MALLMYKVAVKRSRALPSCSVIRKGTEDSRRCSDRENVVF
jgi:hypothetical protein